MRLRVTTPAGGFEYPIPDGASSVVIGSAAGCDVRVTDPGVGDRHLRLDQLMGRWNFSDQFSATGTRHNDTERLSGELQPGDVLTIGTTRIELVADAAPEAPPESPVESPAKSPEAQPSATSKFDLPEGMTGEQFELAVQLALALDQASRSDDDPADREREVRDMAFSAARRVPASRIRHIWIPVLLQSESWYYDVEQDIEGELEDDVSDLEGVSRAIFELAKQEYKHDTGLDLMADPLAATRVADEADEVADTLRLKPAETVELLVPFVAADDNGPKHLGLRVRLVNGAPVLDGRVSAEPPAIDDPLLLAVRDKFRRDVGHDPTSPETEEQLLRRVAMLREKFASPQLERKLISMLEGDPPAAEPPEQTLADRLILDLDDEVRPLFHELLRHIQKTYDLDVSTDVLSVEHLKGQLNGALTFMQATGEGEIDVRLRGERGPVRVRARLRDGRILPFEETPADATKSKGGKTGCLLLLALPLAALWWLLA